MLRIDCANCLLLKALDITRQTLHVIVIDVRYLLEHYLAAIGGFWHKLPARLLHDIDRVMIMVVSDQALGFVGRPPVDILRHVHTSGVCIPCSNGIFAIPSDSGD